MAIKTIRVFAEYTSDGYVPMPSQGNIDYGITIGNSFPETQPSSYQTDDPNIDVAVNTMTDFYVWIRTHGSPWNPSYTRVVRVYPDSPSINSVVMNMIVAVGSGGTSIGGGSGVSYYLNGGTSQGVLDGSTYYEMSKSPVEGTGVDFFKIYTTGYENIAQFVTDAGDPGLLNIPAGNWPIGFYFSASDNSGNPKFYVNIYKYSQAGVFTLLGSGSTNPEVITNGTAIDFYTTNTVIPETTLLTTDRIAVRIFVNTDGNRTVNLHTQDSHLSTVGTTFTRGLTAINGLTKQVQFIAIGNAGSDAAIVSSDDTHTINLPTASATKRGLLNGTDWSTFNAKQAALSGTGFVKIDGSTISYDNSTYQPLDGDLTAIGALVGTTGILKKTGANTWELDTTTYLSTGVAADTYQRKDKMVSNLLASDTEYPNSNAVLAKLALKADIANPQFTGSMNIKGAESRINFYDEADAIKYFIGYDSGFLRIYQSAGSASRFYINSDGKTFIPGILEAGTIIKTGGTASQFLKADGTVDSNTYITSSSLSNYLLSATAASTYQRLDKMVSNLLASDTEYPNSNAVLAALALKANAANPTFTGDFTISGVTPRLYFVDTDNNPDYTLFTDSGYFYIYDQTAGQTKFSINPSGDTVISGALNGTSATFSGNLQVGSGTALSQLKVGNGAGYTGIVLSNNATHYSWLLGSQYNVDNAFEITPSTLVGGSTFTTPVFKITNTGVSTFSSSVTATSFIKSSGTSSQFLKADGTVDSNAYITSSALAPYLLKTGGALSGNLTFSTQGSKIIFGDSTSTSPIMIGEGLVDTEGTDSDFMTMYFRNSFRLFSQLQEVARFTNTGLRVYGSIIKDGGTSSQFLKADGSVDSNTYALSSTLGNYLPLAGGNMTGVLYGSSSGTFYMYNYGRIGLPNAGKILYNNGTGSNMFFGEIAVDVYGYTSNLYSDTPTLAMNLSSRKITINGNNPSGLLTIQSAADGNMFSIRGFISGYGYPNVIEMGVSGADGYLNIKDGAGNIQSVISGYSGTPTYFLSSLLVGTTTSAGGYKFEVKTSTYNRLVSFFDGSYTSGFKFSDLNGGIKYNAGADILELFSDWTAGKLILSTVATPRLTIGSSGNIGIATSPNTSYILDVNGAVSRFASSSSSTLIVQGSGAPYTSILKLAYDLSAYGATITYDANPEKLVIENYGRAISSSMQGGIAFRTKISNTTPTDVLSINGFTGASTFIENITITNVGRPYFIAKTTNSGEEAGIKIQQSTVSDWYFGTAQGTSSAQDLAIRDVSNGRIPLYFQQSTGLSIFPGGARVFNTLTFAGGDRNLECSTSGGVSIYSNEINSGAQGVTGDLYLGWRRTNYVNVGPPMVLSSTLTASGIIYANGGINMGSNAVKMRWGNNNTPTLALPFGDFGTALHIEVSDNDTGGLVISNDGTTVYGAGDQGFVFRVIDEDSYQGGGGVEANTCFKVNQGAGGGGYIKGDFTMTGQAYANAFYETSDSRLKVLKQDDIQVNGIENLKAKLYSKNGRLEYGYYAQEAETYMPSAVTVGMDGYLNLSYREVHTAKIARLEQRVSELEKQLNVA